MAAEHFQVSGAFACIGAWTVRRLVEAGVSVSNTASLVSSISPRSRRRLCAPIQSTARGLIWLERPWY